MNTNIVVSCLLVAFAISSCQADKLGTALYARYVCNSRPNGFKTLVPGSCSKYYMCQDGKAQIKTCPRFFDSFSKVCVYKNPGCVETMRKIADCESSCCGIAEGQYAVDPKNQAVYYLCKNNAVAEKKVCPNDKMFDLVKLECGTKSTCTGCTTKPPCTTKAPCTTATTCTTEKAPSTCKPVTTACTTKPPCTTKAPTTTCTTTTCTTTTCTTTTCTTTTCTTTTCTTTTCTTNKTPKTTCTTTTCTTTTCTTTTCTTTTCTTTTCTTTTCTTNKTPKTTYTTTTCTTTTCTTTTCTTTTCTTTTCTTTTCTTTTCTTTTCTTTTCTTTTCTTNKTPKTTCTTTTCTTTTCTTTTCTTTTCITTKAHCKQTTNPCITTKAPCTRTKAPCITTKAPCKQQVDESLNDMELMDSSQYVLPLKMTTEEIEDYISYGCVHKPDGFLLPSVTICNEYFICRNNIALPVKCGNKYFNVRTSMCDLPKNTGCIQK